jgi:hypothetical protein
MPNSSRWWARLGPGLVVGVVLVAAPATSVAQQPVQGFAVERYLGAAPRSTWLTANDLNVPERLGAETALTLGYARRPLRIERPGGAPLDLVAQQAFMEVALALSFHRVRLSAFLPSPLVLAGDGGTSGGYAYTAPDVTLAHHPDTVSDVRVALDTVFVGAPGGPLRIGADAALFIPSSFRRNYLTDGSVRGLARLLAAGDVQTVHYAASLGVHLRALDDRSAPGTPRGSELMFGVAAAARLVDGKTGALFVGPELSGTSALRGFLAGEGTALEALFGASLTRARGGAMLFHLKLGVGAGLMPALGVPDWRAVASVGVTGLTADR